MRSISMTLSFVLVVVLLAATAAAQTDGAAYDRFLKLTRSSPEAYMEGDHVTAAAEARELLAAAPNYKTDWNYGNAVHAGHLVLGRIALDAGNITEAKRQLLFSVAQDRMPYGFPPDTVKWKASPQLDTFGPGMALALDLLKKGEREVVLKYLDACEALWMMERGRLAQWRGEIKEGKIPDFGPSLVTVFGMPREQDRDQGTL